MTRLCLNVLQPQRAPFYVQKVPRKYGCSSDTWSCTTSHPIQDWFSASVLPRVQQIFSHNVSQVLPEKLNWLIDMSQGSPRFCLPWEPLSQLEWQIPELCPFLECLQTGLGFAPASCKRMDIVVNTCQHHAANACALCTQHINMKQCLCSVHFVQFSITTINRQLAQQSTILRNAMATTFSC